MRNSIGRTAVRLAVVAAAARADVITHDGTTINMAFVDIGNPGNPADTTGDPNPCGAVAYAYRMGTYEVSQSQWDTVNGAASIGDAGGPWTGNQPVAQISWTVGGQALQFGSGWRRTGNGLPRHGPASSANRGGRVSKRSPSTAYGCHARPGG